MMDTIVLGFLIGIFISSVLNFFYFYVVVKYLVDPYVNVTGKLIHESTDVNKSLLHLVAQGSILGGVGGVLQATQLLTNYIASGQNNILKK